MIMKKLFFILALCFSAFASAQCPVVNLPQNAKWKFNFSQCFGDTNTYTYVSANKVAYFDANKNLVYITYAQLADSLDSASNDTLSSSILTPSNAFLKAGPNGEILPISNLLHSGNQQTQYAYNNSVINSGIPRFRTAYIHGTEASYLNTPANAVLGRLGFTGGDSTNNIALGGQIEVIARTAFSPTTSPGIMKISTTPANSYSNNTNVTWYTDENSWQFGFPSPESNNAGTYRIAIGPSNNALAIYNTLSGSTFERGALSWASNEFVLSTQEGGAGVGRNLRMQTPRAGIEIAGGLTTPVIDYDFTASGTPTIFFRVGSGTVMTSTSFNQSLMVLNAGFSASSGSPYKTSIDINNTVNCSGTYSGINYGIWLHSNVTASPDYRGLQVDVGKVFFPIGSGAGSSGSPWLPQSGSTNDSIAVVTANSGQVKLIAQPLAGSATLDFPNTNANEQADLTITVTGAADGDVVALGIPNASTTQGTFVAWVSASNTVTVRFHNTAGGAIDPASGTFKVKVLR